ncbi:MAG: DUF4340 domain-containing protein, partial [Gammaproteobacteria bacterium]
MAQVHQYRIGADPFVVDGARRLFYSDTPEGGSRHMITGRNLGLLGVGTVVVLALAFWLGGLRSPGQLAKQHDLLFPQLTDAVDSISGITLTTAGGEIIATLEKREDRWTIAEKDGYHANDAAVRKLLIQLTDAKVLETKTSNPDLYARLGVEDISGEDAGGMQVTLDGAGEPLSVIVGRTAPQANGTFVRRSGDDFSLLVGGHISPSRTPSLWLDKAIMDIAAQRVHQVVIRQPDGETLELIKGVRGQTDQVVLDVPEGRELQSPVSANSIGGTLGGLRLEDVRAGGDVPEDVTVTEFTTFDGLVITIRSWDEDEMAMAVFNVAFDEELAQRFHEPVKETSADGPGDDAADGPGDDAADGPGDDAADGPDDDAADGPGDDAAD